MSDLNNPKDQLSSSAWEVVHHVSNFYDFPLEGLADLNGAPHAFFVHDELVVPSEEDPDEKEIQVIYALYPVSAELASALSEKHDIFERWHQAWSQDQGIMKHHPALPQDRSRYDELKVGLSAQLDAVKLSVAPLVRAGRFASNRRDVAPGASRWRSFEVQWRP